MCIGLIFTRPEDDDVQRMWSQRPRKEPYVTGRNLQENEWWWMIALIWLRKEPVAGCCWHGNESPVSTKAGNQLTNWATVTANRSTTIGGITSGETVLAHCGLHWMYYLFIFVLYFLFCCIWRLYCFLHVSISLFLHFFLLHDLLSCLTIFFVSFSCCILLFLSFFPYRCSYP